VRFPLPLLLLALALLSGCGPKRDAAVEGGVRRGALRAEGLLVAQVVPLWELPGPPGPPAPPPSAVEQNLEEAHLPAPTALDPVRDAAFLRNEFAGNVRMGGGLVRTGPVALEARARLIERSQEAELGAQGVAWLDLAVREALERRGLPHGRVEIAAPVPERVPVRGLHEDDGTDNLHLPRLALRAGPAPSLPDAGARYLLVPYLRSYYTHNAGWFLGQGNGCMGGARVDVFLVLYDLQTGAVAATMRATGRHIEPHKGQPARAEMDQYLLWAEQQVEAALARELLR
jgi:hypothetical protein